MLKQLLKDEKGQGMTEYGLILALIAVFIIGAVTFFRGKLYALFDDISKGLDAR